MKRYIAIVALLFSCSPGTPDVVGEWINLRGQRLTINDDLRGTLVQESSCGPNLDIFMHRDPYDNYAIRFDPNQAVFIPLELKSLFTPNEYFCSSKDSLPMCSFCRVDEPSMDCDSPEQKLVGLATRVTHFCEWGREGSIGPILTSTLADDCRPPIDTGGSGCRASGPL